MTGDGHPVIRTPDQRIRVFVSSTLRELADERAAVKAAIEKLRLAPVMFELGARPHPPRELYRSYLSQSDVFVGIYGSSYGWIAPDEDVSGLEDEYNLAPRGMPKLIYVKDADTRDERLAELIARIQSDDTAAYLHFKTAQDLEDQVAADLAMLLAERFDQSRILSAGGTVSDADSEAASLASRVPVPYTPTIGREGELAEIRALLGEDTNRLVTLIGPGGIGKSRLAIEAAHADADLFPDGVAFVPLEGVLEPGLLLPTIAFVLGIRDTGQEAPELRIAQAIGHRRMLIVLDNFEQIIDEAPVIVRLYDIAPRATFLVTSRRVLRVRGERVFDVEALAIPDAREPASLETARASTACALFAERAAAVQPGFDLTDDNAAVVVDICRRLEGLPLAIELAAAKIRVFTPREIAARLETSVPLLSTTARDLPERHRTMRATIDWSVGLLSGSQRDMLDDLGVFASRFALDAVEAVGVGRSWGDDPIETLAALIDASLVKRVDADGRSAFSLLAVVREYAVEHLEARGEAETMRIAHADYYRALITGIAPRLRGAEQVEAVTELGRDVSNLRAAARHLVQTDRLDDAADFAWTLLVYWWISGYFAEVRLWMLELLGKGRPITKRTRAIASFFTLWAEMWQRPSNQVVVGIGECVRLFTESGDEHAAAMALAARASTRLQFPDLDPAIARAELEDGSARLHALGDAWAEALAEVALGLLGILQKDVPEALAHLDRAVEIAESAEDAFTRVVAGNNRARVYFAIGEHDAAEREYIVTLRLSARLHFVDGAAYGIEGLCAIAAVRGDAWRAGALAAVAARVRETTGMFDVEGVAVNLGPVETLRASDPHGVAAGERAGGRMGLAEAIRLALPGAQASAGAREEVPTW